MEEQLKQENSMELSPELVSKWLGEKELQLKAQQNYIEKLLGEIKKLQQALGQKG